MIAPAATFQCRKALVSELVTYAVNGYDFRVSGGKHPCTIPLDEITGIRLYTVPGLKSPGIGPIQTATGHCRIESRRGGTIDIRSMHYVSFAKFEDRSAALDAFAKELIGLTEAKNPAVVLLRGMPPLLWWSWAAVFGSLAGGLLLAILLASVGMAMDHSFSASSAAVLALVGLLAAVPIRFLRALWLRRTRPLPRP